MNNLHRIERKVGGITMINGSCETELAMIASESVDVILTDPPYLYLKNQKLDVPFDEQKVFNDYTRILKKGGFVILFGRGTSFYRWNAMLADLGFNFKEEIIWDKGYCSSPLMAMSRIHETVSIHSKGKGSIRKVKIPYLEMKQHDISSIIQDIKRLKTVLSNTKSFDAVMEYLETNQVANTGRRKNLSTSVSSRIEEKDRCASVLKAMSEGMSEKSVVRSDYCDCAHITSHSVSVRRNIRTGNRGVNVVNAVSQGMNEKTIVRIGRDHYGTIHPTQKPIRLLERLLQLVAVPGAVVLDSFAGSMSTGKACINMGMECILIEKDVEYFESGSQSVEKHFAEKFPDR